MSFSDFVAEQLRANETIRDRVISAITDGDVPVCNVDEDLAAAIVRVVNYDRNSRVVTAALSVPWSANMLIDEEGEMIESGTVTAEVMLRHAGKALDYIGGRYDVTYDSCFTDEP